jgi:hypothetical protein
MKIYYNKYTQSSFNKVKSKNLIDRFLNLRRILYRLYDNDIKGAIEMMREYQESLYYEHNININDIPHSIKYDQLNSFEKWLFQNKG